MPDSTPKRGHQLASSLILVVALACHASAATRGIAIVADDGEEITLYDASYALVMGVADYEAGWSDLKNIRAELDGVVEALGDQGFHVSTVMDPTSEELYQALRAFIADYGYEATNRLLFYYSGHGYTRLAGTKGYLVPADAPNPKLDEKGFLQKALPMTDLLAMARNVEASHAMFLFDSCFSGTIFKTRALPQTPPIISRMTSRPVRQFITAGDAGEEVPAKSVFTPAFIEALEFGTGDLNGDGYLTGTELGLHLQTIVPESVQQTPQFGKIADFELSRGDYVFVLRDRQPTPTGRPLPQLTSTPSAYRSVAPPAASPTPQPPVVDEAKVFTDKLRDGTDGPEMVTIPAGRFVMGTVSGMGEEDELPLREVTFDRPFAIARYELTFAEYLEFTTATSRRPPYDKNWGKDRQPVIDVTWDDALAYARWLSEETGERYRLPSEAEWEYAARARTTGFFHFGDQPSTELANYDGTQAADGRPTGEYRARAVPVGSFRPNTFGVHDMHGNVAEWVADCYHENYDGAPEDGSARIDPPDCTTRVIRGGSWIVGPKAIRAAARSKFERTSRYSFVGIRLARDL